jgi:hypothetical protein
MSLNSTQSPDSLEKAQIRELEHRIEKLEMEKENQKYKMMVEKLEIENEKCKMEIKFLKRIYHQQRKFETEKKVLLQSQTEKKGVKKVDVKLEEQQQEQQQELFFSLHGFHGDSFRSELSPNGDELLLLNPAVPSLSNKHSSLSSSRHNIARIMACFKVTSIGEINYYKQQSKSYKVKMIRFFFRKVVQEIKSLQGRLISSEQEEHSLQQSLQQERKRLKLKLQQYYKSFRGDPPQMDDPIIAQFQPVSGQYSLHQLDYYGPEPFLRNYIQFINSTPLAVFRYLIETKGAKINPTNNLLYFAFQSFNTGSGGDVNTLIYLLSKLDVDVNSASYYNTLLQNACFSINRLPLDVFKYLIEINGANINDQALRPVFWNHPNHRNFHSNGSNVRNILIYLLSQKSIDVNVRGQDGRTWLQLVFANSYLLSLEVLKYLVEIKGAKVDDCDKYGRPPLDLLLSHSRSKSDSELSQIVQYLIQKMGELNPNFHFHTPSHISMSTHPLTYQVIMDAQKK